MATVVSAEVERTRRLIDGLRRDRRAHPYHGRREYSQRAREVAEACAALIEVEPAAVPALTRRAVDLVTTALMYMDDSSGIVGDDLHELMRLHAQACCTAPPDPKRLAAWLAKIRLDGPGWPDFELRDFAPALSERGRTELARIVEERARTTEPDVFGGTPFGIRALREQLAEISGDLDHYIAVLAQDLRTARQYLKIIQVLRGAGHAAEAENWAYRGLAGLGNPIDMDKLRDAYVDLLLERGANDDAIILSQKLFATQPTQTNYHALRRTAERAGDWESLRNTAIGRLRAAVHTNPAYADHLIGVLIDEAELDAAWQVTADQPDAVLESRWQQLIDLRQRTHPADVIASWQRLIEQRLGLASDKYRYGRAIKMLRRLRDAYRATDDDAGFRTYLDDLQDRHRRKTSFLAKLDRAKL